MVRQIEKSEKHKRWWWCYCLNITHILYIHILYCFNAWWSLLRTPLNWWAKTGETKKK
jgi:hypothetical protein